MKQLVARNLRGFLSNPRGGFLRQAVWGVLRRLTSGSPTRNGIQVLEVLPSPASVAWGSERLYPEGARIQIHLDSRPSTAEHESALAPAGVGWRIENVAVTENYRFQAGIHDNYLLLSNRDDESPWQLNGPNSWAGSHIVASLNNTVAVSHRHTTKHLQSGVFVGTRSPTVWAHWLVNFLPSVFLASRLGAEFDDFPLIVPTSIPEDSHWRESLQLAAGGRKTVSVNQRNYVLVRDMLWIEPPVYDTPFPINGRESGVWLSEGPLLDFRQLFLDYASAHGTNSRLPREVFLARKPKPGRTYSNQNACIRLAEKYGFEAVFVEDLSLADKIRLFRDARNVIGPGGSGFTNLLFSGPSTTGLFWWHEPLKLTENYGPNVAAVGGSKMLAAPASWVEKKSGDGSYAVKLDALEAGIQNLIHGSSRE